MGMVTTAPSAPESRELASGGCGVLMSAGADGRAAAPAIGNGVPPSTTGGCCCGGTVLLDGLQPPTMLSSKRVLRIAQRFEARRGPAVQRSLHVIRRIDAGTI